MFHVTGITQVSSSSPSSPSSSSSSSTRRKGLKTKDIPRPSQSAMQRNRRRQLVLPSLPEDSLLEVQENKLDDDKNDLPFGFHVLGHDRKSKRSERTVEKNGGSHDDYYNNNNHHKKQQAMATLKKEQEDLQRQVTVLNQRIHDAEQETNQFSMFTSVVVENLLLHKEILHDQNENLTKVCQTLVEKIHLLHAENENLRQRIDHDERNQMSDSFSTFCFDELLVSTRSTDCQDSGEIYDC